jgi:hypothetical protein
VRLYTKSDNPGGASGITGKRKPGLPGDDLLPESIDVPPPVLPVTRVAGPGDWGIVRSNGLGTEWEEAGCGSPLFLGSNEDRLRIDSPGIGQRCDFDTTIIPGMSGFEVLGLG